MGCSVCFPTPGVGQDPHDFAANAPVRARAGRDGPLPSKGGFWCLMAFGRIGCLCRRLRQHLHPRDDAAVADSTLFDPRLHTQGGDSFGGRVEIGARPKMVVTIASTMSDSGSRTVGPYQDVNGTVGREIGVTSFTCPANTTPYQQVVGAYYHASWAVQPWALRRVRSAPPDSPRSVEASVVSRAQGAASLTRP